jgi:rhodanese-related sulfurtransferase
MLSMPQSKPPRRRLTKRTIVFLVLLAGILGGLLWDGSPLASLALRQAVHLKFRNVRQVAPADLVEWMRDPNRPPPLLVDARSTEEFGLSHLQGAVRVDPKQPDLAAFAHVPRDQPLVVYDAAGVMGAAMVVGLTQAGFSRVSSLDGGIFRWVNEGHPVVNDSGPSAKVYPLSWSWGRLLKERFHP